ncbi:hypothetical protein FK216_03360 [Moraxellaceae bacterium AER2_44_116]|nr:hypothetical protein [Moraxellaceae bacterium]TQC99285.1 hypothetical protein FK216_03360 [Moraxellaceae bacterium AER2_44_116]
MNLMWTQLQKPLMGLLIGSHIFLSGCGGGGSSGDGNNTASANNTPTIAITASSISITTSSAGLISASLGSDITISGSGSTDADGDTLSYQWSLQDKPASSTVILVPSSSVNVKFMPDAMGVYDFLLTVTDAKGAKSEKHFLIKIDNLAPTANTQVNVGFVATPTVMPIQSVHTGSTITLDGTASVDPEGGNVSLEWFLEKPVSSTAILALTGKTAKITTDILGIYKIRVKGIDAKGAFFETVYAYNADNKTPLDKTTSNIVFSSNPVSKPTLPVTVNALITLDSSQSTDPDGGALNLVWKILAKPQTSIATLAINGKQARFTPDVLGAYQVSVRSTDTQGAYAETIYTFDANNQAPTSIIATDVGSVSRDAGTNSISTSLGYTVLLDSKNSVDPEANALTYEWSIESKPTNSTLNIGNATASTLQFIPDVMGDYSFKLTVKDNADAISYFVSTIKVNNQRPTAIISSNATPMSLPQGPTIRLPLGTEVTLRGSASKDADGDPLSYLWTIVTKPLNSTAALATPNSMNSLFVPDKAGSYTFKLKTSDPSGAYSEQNLILDTGNTPPVAVLDKSNITALTGAAVTASAGSSYDEDGDTLRYRWFIDARPVGSTAAITNNTAANMSFTPDMAGAYSLAVEVSDGTNSHTAYLGLKVLAQSSGSVALTFAPLLSKYSQGLDKLVVVASNPNALKIIDPFTGAIRSVALAGDVTSLSLSPNGKLAAVLYSGTASLIDIEKATLIKTFTTAGAQTDLFATNTGSIYLIGQSGGQWVDEGVARINGYSGQREYTCCSWSFYGTQKGIFADKINKVFLMEFGLSPSDIDYFTLDGTTGDVIATGDSPYHGDYSMYSPLFLSGNQSLVFTGAGNYFNTGSLRYAGKLALKGGLVSLSHSSEKEEALVTIMTSSDNYPYEYSYQPYYQLFTGSLLADSGTLALPLINSQQSYGLEIFHSANGSHVVLVQTGSNLPQGMGVKYHVIFR